MWFFKIMRRFFISIDSVLFNFIGDLYDTLLTISRTSILSQGEIAELAKRIELLLGIFMLFKLTFSLITYIVNPEDFTDKSKGFGKLIQGSVISLVMLVLVPYIFQMAYNLQAKVLEGNILAKIILAEDEESDDEDSYLNNAGEDMAFTVMLPFFQPNVGIANSSVQVDLSECVNLYQGSGENKKFNESCKQALADANMNQVNLNNYANGIELRSLGLTFRTNTALDTVGEKDDEVFLINYMAPLSTVAAVIVCLLLITFCMDIGVRSVKLAFLQLVYPIPVISYMDPKGGKDGLFKKWYQMCLTTYLSLFVRLLALYFGIYIISKVSDLGLYDVINGSEVTGLWINLFVIIGVLMFVKQLPKILQNLGIKIDGDGTFQLNPLKKFEKDAIGGKRILGASTGLAAAGLAGAAAFGTNALTGAQRFKNAEGAKGKALAALGGLGSMIAGGVSATSRGLVGVAKNEKFGKNFSNSYGGAMTARTNRADRRDLGVSAFDVWGENLKRNMHIDNEAQKFESELKHLDEYVSAGKEAKTRAEGEVDKKASSITINGKNLGALRDKYDILKNTQIKRNDYATDQAYEDALDDLAKKTATANADYFKARKDAVNAYVKHADNLNGSFGTVDFSQAGFTTDTIVSSNLSKMEQLNDDYKMGQSVRRGDIGKSIQNAEDRQTEIKGSREYRKSELISQQAQNEKRSK